MSKVYFNHTSKLEITKRKLAPACTIALQKSGNQFHYGIAICSKYDNFSKKIGRDFATTRMDQGFGVMPVPEVLMNLPEAEACRKQLYNLTASVVVRNRRWKKRLSKFNSLKRFEKAKILMGNKTAPEEIAV